MRTLDRVHRARAWARGTRTDNPGEAVRRWGALLAGAAALGGLSRCKSPGDYRQEADRAAYGIIESHQQAALGRTEPFTIESAQDTLRRRLLLGQDLPYATAASLSTKDIEPIEQWPDDGYLTQPDPPGFAPPWSGSEPITVTLLDALQIGARNSREYQFQKEGVYQAALRLDLERWEFRGQWAGLAASGVSTDLEGDDTTGAETTAELAFLRRFESGMTFLGRIGFDLAQLLSGDKASSLGLFADATVTVPLLRGSGKFVVTEPLTQADRDVVYAIYDFERFKKVFAVQIAEEYLSVLQLLDVVRNTEENYRWLVGESRRARRMAATGRLPEIQVDQALQDELLARDQWIVAIQDHERRLDTFKEILGLPVDAAIALDEQELGRLIDAVEYTPLADLEARAEAVPADAPIVIDPPGRAASGLGAIDPTEAVVLALVNRLDLRVAVGRIYDAQRIVAVAADGLRADLTLLGNGSLGGRRTLADAGLPDAELDPDDGSYSVVASLDLPLYRIPERNLYRNSLIALEQARRGAQAVEDRVKREVRDDLRVLLESRERLRIQAQSVELARRRVESTQLFLRAQRADIRDVLEAQEDLLDALNELSFEAVRYRIADLSLQRDLELLQVNEEGLWTEYEPPAPAPAGG